MINTLFSSQRLFFLLVFFPALVFGQSQPLDTGFLSSAIAHAKEIYSTSLGNQLHLYNGVRYRDFNSTASDRGIPFLGSDDWVDGTVVYDGEKFEHVPIMFDVVNDRVMIDHGIKLQLIDSKIKTFSLPGHLFIHILHDSIKNSLLPDGYYDLVVDGRVKLYIKWHKERSEVIEDQEVRAIYTDRNTYYVWKAGEYLEVNSKSSLLKVLNDNLTLRKFIRKNNINFHHNRAEALAKVVAYYNSSAK